MPRTSLTDPLRIDAVPLANGRLGLTICPGKQGDSVQGAPWARDLETDVRAIADWGADIVVSLTEMAEMAMLGVPGLPGAVRAAGMEWAHFPIPDLQAPPTGSAAAWRALSARLHARLEAGGRVLLHCRGGLGRAGTIAAALLVERGRTAPEAVAAVRAARPHAIETPAQEAWLASHAGSDDGRAMRVRASLLGGAVGDALGADIEFLPLAAILRRHPDGIAELPPHRSRRGAITDDTQMTLFTAEGLVRARLRERTRGICHGPSVVHHALLRWLRTQDGRPQVTTDDAGLVADPRLADRRAPGNTCLAALEAATRLGEPAANDSKGCGTIMRVAPVGLLVPREQVRGLAVETSALTHGHVTGQLAAAAWAELLAEVLARAPVETAAMALGLLYAGLDGGTETAAAIDAALRAPRDGRPETVEALGGGWVAEEALAIALYAALVAEDFAHGLRVAVTHGGDSDSTGAVAGNLLGLMFPEETLAHPWTAQVECADLLVRIARDWDRAGTAGEGRGLEDLLDAYPPG